MLASADVEGLDPQVMAPGADAWIAQRTVVRTLTAPGSGSHAGSYVADLATSLGEVSADGRSGASLCVLV